MNDRMRRMAGYLLLAGLLAGCNPDPPEETVFDEQLEALERAKQVEETLMKRATEIGERLDNEVDGNKKDPPQ